jgi:hypothetical protein
MIAVLREAGTAGSARLRTMGQAARAVAIHTGPRERALAAVCDVLEGVAPRSAAANHCDA